MRLLRELSGRATRGLRTSCALALCLASAATALHAHVNLVASTPARGATIDAPPAELRLRFSGRIEPRYTSLSLAAPDGAVVPLGTITFVEGSDREFTAAMPPIVVPGTYTVRWRTAGADGHVLEGSYTFDLAGDTAAWRARLDTAPGAPPPVLLDVQHEYGEAQAASGLGVSAVLARWLHFVSLVLIIGALTFRLALLPRLRSSRAVDDSLHAGLVRTTWRVLAFAALVLAAAAVLRLWTQSSALHGADRAWDGALLSLMITDTSWGRGWLLQAFLFAVLGAAIAYARPPRDRIALFLAVPSAAGLAAIPALTGHAAGERGAGLIVLNDALHVIAAGAWLGTLALLMLAALPLILRRSTAAQNVTNATNATNENATLATNAVTAAIERFSRLALMAAALLVLTGVINSLLHLRAVADLTGTPYGRVLLVKLGLFLLVVAAGFVNWRIVRPALARTDGTRRLRLSAGVELALALLVLLATAVLTGTARP
jgi:putative copper export protein/methionine-rich copper-binding protein CopC